MPELTCRLSGEPQKKERGYVAKKIKPVKTSGKKVIVQRFVKLFPFFISLLTLNCMGLSLLSH
jgi:hypothetical protein